MYYNHPSKDIYIMATMYIVDTSKILHHALRIYNRSSVNHNLDKHIHRGWGVGGGITVCQ